MARFVGYVVKRVLNYIVMIFVATSLTYFLASAFMSPRSNYESRTPRPPQESIEWALDAANLNDKTPIMERYQKWIGDILTKGDFGKTPTGASVNHEISSRIGASVQLMLLATIISIVVGVSLGVYTAQRQYQWQDRFWSGVASLFMVIPTVVLAILIVFFAIEVNTATGTRIFYVTGLSSYSGSNFFIGLLDFLQHILLPTIVLTIISAVGYHLGQRTYLLNEMHADYVRTARAKGLTKKQAIRKHALRASLIPTAVSVAFSIAGIFTGAVMTEKIFAIHGLGEYFINCINNNNIHGAVAVAAFSGACTLVGALLADLFAAALDPRIKMS
ncbi:ABC transporter permease [Atopobium sp. oral taxon 810]|uniref:ABC transporter permease n=1 Tax=Atopobium sp. oral taxon 810 TaxID=712158 RepID=UPI000396FFF6|nr:ABC transporter permease [Atopobium sp. oral taxon 810]ERI05777.1 ABC transporter, permease protein [Atopobium sp. oral taxon 810 str. F0209]